MLLGEFIDALYAYQKVLVTFDEDSEEVVLYDGVAGRCPNELDRCIVEYARAQENTVLVSLLEVNE